LHTDDINNKKAVQFMLPEEFRHDFDQEAGVKRMVTDSGSPLGKCKLPDYTSVMRAVDDLPGEGASMLSWRGGHVSVFPMASAGPTTGLRPQSNREQIRPTLHRVETFPNYGLVSMIVGTAVRTIERADCLFGVRRTARPHTISFDFTRD
jgi:hypothetical protein